MEMVKLQRHIIMNDLAEPQFFEEELDTSDYVPDEDAISKSIEKNQAIAAALSDKYKKMLGLKQY